MLSEAGIKAFWSWVREIRSERAISSANCLGFQKWAAYREVWRGV